MISILDLNVTLNCATSMQLGRQKLLDQYAPRNPKIRQFWAQYWERAWWIDTVHKSHYRPGNHHASHFMLHGTRAIIKVKGHQYRWLAGGYDLEIGHV